MSDIKKKIKEFFTTVKIVSVSTCIGNKPSCRIMEVQKVEENLKLFFATHKSSPKVEYIQKNNNVCIVSRNTETLMDIRLFGTCRLAVDMETKKSIWRDELAPYFLDGGIDDPDLAVLVFTPERIEYRDSKTGSLNPEVENL
ncbi:MAG: pyridoxamine 5'-phosphate oxidase family protein [Candidatus Brocadiaceae bacterium]|nr:pyridoxamine 5'-phosphate oxidase family protein [Candidatus Brocadiaceae bacterium]